MEMLVKDYLKEVQCPFPALAHACALTHTTPCHAPHRTTPHHPLKLRHKIGLGPFAYLVIHPLPTLCLKLVIHHTSPHLTSPHTQALTHPTMPTPKPHPHPHPHPHKRSHPTPACLPASQPPHHTPTSPHHTRRASKQQLQHKSVRPSEPAKPIRLALLRLAQAPLRLAQASLRLAQALPLKACARYAHTGLISAVLPPLAHCLLMSDWSPSASLCKTTHGVLCINPDCPGTRHIAVCRGTDGYIGDCAASCFGQILRFHAPALNCKLYVEVSLDSVVRRRIQVREQNQTTNRAADWRASSIPRNARSLSADLTQLAGRSFDLWIGVRLRPAQSPDDWCALNAAQLVDSRGGILKVNRPHRYWPGMHFGCWYLDWACARYPSFLNATGPVHIETTRRTSYQHAGF